MNYFDLSLIKKFRWFLAPSILQAGVAFATLPLATLILGPQDYGAYAVVAAITGLPSSVACLGSSYLLARTFSGGKSDEIRQLISQQIVISGGLAILFATLLILTWSNIIGCFDNLAMVPTAGFVLSAIGIVPATVFCPCCNHTFHRWQHVRAFDEVSISAFMSRGGFITEKAFATDFSAKTPWRKFKSWLWPLFRRPSPHLVYVGRKPA